MICTHPNGDAVRALLKAAYNRDFDQAASFASPDIEVIDEISGHRFVGHEGLRQFVHYWLDTFRDFQYDIVNLVADENGVAIEYVYQAWHVAEPSIVAEDIPPGARSIQSRSAAFFHETILCLFTTCCRYRSMPGLRRMRMGPVGRPLPLRQAA